MRSRREVILAGIAVLLTPGAHAAGKPLSWQVQIVQIDQAGTMVGNAHDMPCPEGGCQAMIQLDVGGKPQRFLAVVTFVEQGAYLALRSATPDVGKVIQFEQGFEGPIFIPIRNAAHGSETTLNFILTGPAATEADSGEPQLMRNDQSLVFQRKLNPDLTLKIELSPAAKAG